MIGTSYWQQRWRRWWQSRLKASDTLALHHRNVYIIPTGAGWMMAVTVAVLLLTSVNYQLNLGYLLTFMVAGASVASMWVAHANLRGLVFTLSPPGPTAAHHSARLQVTCTNPTGRHRHAIVLSAHEGPQEEEHLTWVSLAPGQSVTVGVRLPERARGHHPMPLLRARTSFPLGLLRAWAVWQPASPLVVYPAPENPVAPWPVGDCSVGEEAAGRSHQPAVDEFDGVRPYRVGDPLKTIVWKKVVALGGAGDAASQAPQWMVRDVKSPKSPPRIFYFEQTGCADVEQALSRLCAWVLHAHELSMDYGLTLPNERIAVCHDEGQRQAHVRQCLEALARC